MADKKLLELCSKNEELIGKHMEMSKKHLDLARKHADLHTELKRYAEDKDEKDDADDVENNEEETPKTETDKPNPDEKKKEKNEVEVEKLEWSWEQWMEKDQVGLMKLAVEDSPIYLKLQKDMDDKFLSIGTRGLEAKKEREKLDKNK